MINTQIYGIYSEGRTLCLSCAERSYGNSLELYVEAGEAQVFSDKDHSKYASTGLLCNDCFRWIFPPDQSEDNWWLVEPNPEEHLRLLAPFAAFLETLQIDTVNLRELSQV